MRVFLAMLTVALPLMIAVDVAAQAMQSTSYKIQSDSINIGGGSGSSTTYRLESTVGEVATGRSTSASYEIGAGFQQMQETYLALTAPNDITLTPDLGGITGGESNGSTAVTAATDSAGGYQLSIAASTSPAMQSGVGDMIPDYAPAGANPDFAFAVVAGTSSLGFTPEGTDIAARFKDNGSVCGTGSADASLSCWDGLSTSGETIAERTSSNHPLGTETEIHFRVGIGSTAMQAPGTYVATTTLTLIAL